jgi:hypothetical protein
MDHLLSIYKIGVFKYMCSPQGLFYIQGYADYSVAESDAKLKSLLQIPRCSVYING